MLNKTNHPIRPPARHRVALAVGLALAFLSPQLSAVAPNNAPAVANNGQLQAFSIAQQPLRSALLQFAEQAKLQVFFADVELDGMTAQPLQGNFPVQQGLRQLIGSNPVQFSITGDQRIVLSHLATTASSQVGGTSDLVLDELVVQGSRNTAAGDWVYQEPRAVSVISRQQLDNRPTRHAADMLEQTTGVYSSVSQQDPALSVNIRGIQDYGRVNMNIDGMRQNFQKSGHGQRNGTMFIDSELLSGVTIEKGTTSGMGSGGTFGGIATFNTVNASDFLAPGKEFGGKLHASTGDNATRFIGSSILALGNETGDILVGASERHLGDYWPGNKGNIGDIRIDGNNANYDKLSKDLKNNKITDSNYVMRSRLAKVGWNLPGNQRLQLSYLQTQTSSPNASTLANLQPVWPYELGWKQTGYSDVMSRTAGIDYSLNPENVDWLDFKTKFYYVDTVDNTTTYGGTQPITPGFDTRTQVQTYGFQAENTSHFYLSSLQELRANYGVDIFYDKANDRSTREEMNGSTPNGNRSLSSLFANLTYDYDQWFTAQAGIRYDRYRLRGVTGMDISDFPYTPENPCKSARLSQCGGSVNRYQEWDIDRQQTKFSPTFALSVKPGVEWLELYTNYGKSWRPPAITETLVTGSAHSSSVMYPNPFLQDEKSKAWELGVNVQKANLWTEQDRLVAKVSYFDTKVDNYINQQVNRIKPGTFNPGIGNAAYVNNLARSRFRGLEYQLNYDMGYFYTDLTYTHMIGKNNYCSNTAWLGGVKYVGGSRNNWYAVDADNINQEVACSDGSIFGSAAYLPGDRGALTLGGRAFDRKLDAGVIVRFNPGFQDHNANPNNPYLADWPKYTLVDLYASYRLTDNLTVRGSVENLANRAYVVSYGESLSNTLGRGRTIQGGVEYKF